MTERFMVAVLKTVISCILIVGSNPTVPLVLNSAVEYFSYKEKVSGSNPLVPKFTNYNINLGLVA